MSSSNNQTALKVTEILKMAPNVETLVKLLNFSEAKPYGKIQKTFLTFNGKPLKVQTPKMRSPGGMYQYRDEEKPNDETKDSISLSFGGENEQVQEFHKFCKMLDEAILKMASEQMAPVWVGKKSISLEGAKDKYTPIASFSKDKGKSEPNGKYPDSIKIKLGKDSGKYYCDLYDENKNLIPDSEFANQLTKGCECAAIVKFAHVWFGKTGFGVTITPEQLKTDKKASGGRRYGFAESDDEEENIPVLEAKKEQPVVVETKKVEVSDSDSDSESESDSDSESEEEVKPAPKGKGRAPAKK